MARAVITRPDIIFADEPTGNLDTRSGTEVLALLRRALDEFGQTVATAKTHVNRAMTKLGACPLSGPLVVAAYRVGRRAPGMARLTQPWYFTRPRSAAKQRLMLTAPMIPIASRAWPSTLQSQPPEINERIPAST